MAQKPNKCVNCGVHPQWHGADYNIVFEDAMATALVCPYCQKRTQWHKTIEEVEKEWNEINV